MNCVYQIINLLNNKMYIGSTNNYQRRMREHRAFIGCDPSRKGYYYPLYCAFRKYGLQNFTFKILVDNIESLREARQLEEKLIKQYSCKVPNGYNLKESTEGLSESDIEHIVEKTGYACALVDNNETIIKTYNSLREASRDINIDATSIAKVCRGESYSTHGQIYRFLDENKEIIEIIPKYSLKYVPICGISPFTQEKIYFLSLKEAAEYCQVTPNLISKCIAGDSRYKIVKGYIWRKFINNKIVENNFLVAEIIDYFHKKYIYLNNEYKTLHEWCKIYKLPYDKIRYQINSKHREPIDVLKEFLEDFEGGAYNAERETTLCYDGCSRVW